MADSTDVQLDVVIFGGGVAGLWLLDELHRAGYAAVVLEAAALGAGQTVASQGIIHGGLKYTLDGLLNASADAIREMPGIWRDCLAGRREPNLSGTAIRAKHCHLWRTGSWKSKLGMIGARAGLRVAPVKLSPNERPTVLANCPGDVFRLDEQVLSPHGLLADLARRHAGRVLRIDWPDGVGFEHDGDGNATAVNLRDAATERRLALRPQTVVIAAGGGAGELRERLGLADDAMQLRPLHMVMARGATLPVLNGHCVDAAHTRVTITSDTDSAERTVWQVGGQVAEDGVAMDEDTLLPHARDEVRAALSGIDLAGVEWAAYRVDRAEATTAGGRRPATEIIRQEANVITAWPTKLALAPRLANIVRAELPSPARLADAADTLKNWPKPAVAAPPWERDVRWRTLD